MSTILVATIGNSDVQETGPDGGFAHYPHARRVGRDLVEMIDAGEDLREICALPIIGPTVEKLVTLGAPPDHVVLIATDQPESAGDGHRKDTLYYARVVRWFLERWEGLSATITTWEYRANPADYGVSFPWMRVRMGDLLAHYPGAAVYVSPVGGTPAMASALIIEAVAHFGAQARILYKDRDATEARAVDAAEDLLAQNLRRSLAAAINAYSFTAADALCDASPAAVATLIPHEAKRLLFRALLRHGTERLNANSKGARQALRNRDLKLLTEDERRIMRAAPVPDGRETDAETIREVIAQARLLFSQRRYYDFASRIGTFLDTATRYTALHRCGVTEDTGGSAPLARWYERDCPEPVRRRLRGIGFRYTEKIVTRDMYRTLISQLMTPDVEPVYHFLDAPGLHEIDLLRNGCLHRFDGITAEEIAVRWGDSRTDIVTYLEEVAARMGIRNATDDPYGTLRRALHRLMEPDPDRA